jgi:hypothetical protein
MEMKWRGEMMSGTGEVDDYGGRKKGIDGIGVVGEDYEPYYNNLVCRY